MGIQGGSPPKTNKFSTLLIESLQRGINVAILPGPSRFMIIHIHIYQYLLKYIAVGIPDTARYINIHHIYIIIHIPLTSSYFKRIRNCIDDFKQESFSNGVWDALKLPTSKGVHQNGPGWKISSADLGIILGQHWIVWL